MVYYGLGMTSTSLGGSVHLNYVLTMFIEFPAYGLCLLVLNRYGRRFPFAVLLIAGGLACLGTGVVPPGEIELRTVESKLTKYSFYLNLNVRILREKALQN